MPMVQEICSKIKLAEIDEKFHCLSDFFFSHLILIVFRLVTL